MSDLSGMERRKLEKLFGMGSGYVLNFSDRTYSDFFVDYRVEIDAVQYRAGGDSKAKRMRKPSKKPAATVIRASKTSTDSKPSLSRGDQTPKLPPLQGEGWGGDGVIKKRRWIPA